MQIAFLSHLSLGDLGRILKFGSLFKQASVIRKNCTVNLRRRPTFRAGFLLGACLLLIGCARNTFTVSSLPPKFVAREVANFSTLDLTAYARPASSAHEIRSGDQLELTLNSGIGGPDAVEKWNVGVDDEGAANLPTIGRVHLAGLTQAQAEKSIAQEGISREVYLTPAVDVRVRQRQENQITVAGAVEEPGLLKFFESTLTLADVLVRSGGLKPDASGTITINSAISTSNEEVGDLLSTVSSSQSSDAVTVNLATTSAAELSAIQVASGAHVSVEERPEQFVLVTGVINDRPVKVPAGRSLRLLDALGQAGGPTYSHWVSDRIDVIRRVPGKNETVRIKASIRKAKKDDAENLLLSPNDIVSVEENLLSFTLSALGGMAGVTNAARVATIP